MREVRPGVRHWQSPHPGWNDEEWWPELVSSYAIELGDAESANTLSNEYVLNGYEASFGSYDVDDVAHTVTHYVQGSVTRDLLVGQDLPRKFEFTSDGHLIIRSARPEEHWSVTWEHY